MILRSVIFLTPEEVGSLSLDQLICRADTDGGRKHNVIEVRMVTNVNASNKSRIDGIEKNQLSVSHVSVPQVATIDRSDPNRRRGGRRRCGVFDSFVGGGVIALWRVLACIIEVSDARYPARYRSFYSLMRNLHYVPALRILHIRKPVFVHDPHAMLLPTTVQNT